MKKLLATFCLFLTLTLSFAQKKDTEITLRDIKSGDLIFVGAQQQDLSGAINRVTQKSESASFDHIGIIEMTKDYVFVLHASSTKGSVRQEIRQFYEEQQDGGNALILYRLKDPFISSIPAALKTAGTMLGKPYNRSYIMNDSCYYCSDFIYRAFEKNQIFSLAPMTFINPETGKTDDFWKTFYKKQNLEVPEGKPGCNPNGMAASEKLNRLGRLYL
ncbi:MULTISPECIES: YiiX/YebB-like N1pC/P60 family cysteine hydrolase [unclassified Sphingobacterium]|uniref:YiiX/YebB-like N1pC/P60 family cysteine hydrolase n=1 Tax=unclassified Sphingobacterium TaxID=2609468 RepID=UPI0025EE7F69|nr:MULTISPECIES: YiiX/YebB-like N1pC/P60 family cysteine hydrolase [unclassified Sphingobacterium]